MEAALLQEMFSRLVSLNLLSEEAMMSGPHCKGRCRHRCAGGETLPGETGAEREGASWDVGEVSRAWGGEGGVGQRGPLCVCAVPRWDPHLRLHCGGLAWALLL